MLLRPSELAACEACTAGTRVGCSAAHWYPGYLAGSSWLRVQALKLHVKLADVSTGYPGTPGGGGNPDSGTWTYLKWTG
eukprot:3781406-Rhodomonas_salina.1